MNLDTALKINSALTSLWFQMVGIKPDPEFFTHVELVRSYSIPQLESAVDQVQAHNAAIMADKTSSGPRILACVCANRTIHDVKKFADLPHIT